MVRLEADTGHEKYAPFNLRPYDIVKYSVKINGIEHAGCMVDQDLISVYHESRKSFNGDHFIPFENYKNGSFVIVVDCNKQSDENTVQVDVRANLDIQLHFKSGLPHNVKLFIMGTVDSTLSIDNDRFVSTDFQV